MTNPDASPADLWTESVASALEGLHTAIDDADRSLGIAQMALRELTDPHALYDTELVEGPDAADIRDELAAAHRALRNVRRIVVVRRKQLHDQMEAQR